LHIKVHAANIHDTIAAPDILKETFEKYSTIIGVSADAGYRGATENFVIDNGKIIHISTKHQDGWIVLAKRWIVERTFGWLNGFRRLSKDYEISLTTAENYIRISHLFTLVSRIS